MSTLLKELKRIIDLKEPLEEAKKKLTDTYMLVNGRVAFVRSFDNADDNIIFITDTQTGEHLNEDVKTLDVWLPETGVYKLKDGYCAYITKIPKRQWAKSFNRNFYKAKILGLEKDLSTSRYTEVANSVRESITNDIGGNIWFLNKRIGIISNKTVTCLDKNYLQELKDWSKYAIVGI